MVTHGYSCIGPEARRGNILVIVLILAMVIMTGVFSLSFLTKTDVSTTSILLRELQATYLAESVAVQVAARVNSMPWHYRFWYIDALAKGTIVDGTGVSASMTFDENTGVANLSGDSLPPGEYTYMGVVKDLPSTLREYRLYLEVVVDGELYAFSWDKRYDMALLASLNHDTTMVDKIVDSLNPAPDPADKLIEVIKTEAEEAPPPEAVNQNQITKLAGLREDEKSFKARALTPDPTNGPTVPSFEWGDGGDDKGDWKKN